MPESLAEWFGREGVVLEAGLGLRRARPEGGGYSVRAEKSVAAGSSVAQIPKRSVLSHQTTSLDQARLASLPNETPVAFRLAVCVLHELLLGPKSRWATYLAHCPAATVPIAILWDGDGTARQVTRGTELDTELKRIGISKASLATFFTTTALPTCFPSSTHSLYTTPPTLSAFLHAYSLVSSRAFQVDAYHSLALVPLADLFNHASPNHVHLASDDFVCPECGSLYECEHDRDEGVARGLAEDEGAREEDDTCEMVADAEIAAGDEVFNTYGQLSNASLLAYYGFMLEVNELDRVTFTLDALGLDDLQQEEWMVWRADRALAAAAMDLELDGLVCSPEPVDVDQSLTDVITDDHAVIWIDADANLSWPLYLALVAAAVDPASEPSAVTPLRSHALAVLRATAQQWHAFSGVDTAKDEDAPPAKRPRLTAGAPEATKLVARVAQQVRTLVEASIAGQYRPELSGTELLEMTEGADGDADGPDRLALEFLASERLVLECVLAKWEQLAAWGEEA